MTRVNLDTQPEAIRQFLLALSASTEGAVLESAGRAVACVVAPPPSASMPEGEWAWLTCPLVCNNRDGRIYPGEQ